MANIFETRRKLDLFLELLASSKVDRFYPSALSKHLGISFVEAFNLLLERTGPGDQLILIWEIRCPHCYRTLKVTNKKDINEELYCNCGEEIELKSSDFFPVFQFNSEYKDYIKRELKKKNAIRWETLQLI